MLTVQEKQWLTERQTCCGASESPILFGQGYKGQSPYSLWVDKTTPLTFDEDVEQADHLVWGKIVQPAILAGFTHKTGLQTFDPGQYTIRRHPDYPYIGSTLDAEAEDPLDGRVVVEAKNVGHFADGDWEDGEAPLRVQIQCQSQLACTGYKAAYAAVSLGGRMPEWRKIYRNDRFIANLIQVITDFWALVESRTPPEVDGSEGTTRAVARLYSQERLGDVKVLPPEAAIAAAKLERCKKRLKTLEEMEAKFRNQLITHIGESTIGVLPSGDKYSYKTVAAGMVAAYVRKQYRTLRKMK